MAHLPESRNRMGVNGARVIRLAIAVAAILATAVLAASAFATSRAERNLHGLNRQVLAAVNRFRVAHGLGGLRESGELDRSARQHSLEMGRLGYFSHSSADGTIFWRRIQQYYPAHRNAYWAAGENMLWRAPGVSADGAMKMWIASPEHLKNLLSARWRQIGVSAVRVVHAPGVYHGWRVIIITTDFGARH
jgi:uncharacterized protein YkwD